MSPPEGRKTLGTRIFLVAVAALLPVFPHLAFSGCLDQVLEQVQAPQAGELEALASAVGLRTEFKVDVSDHSVTVSFTDAEGNVAGQARLERQAGGVARILPVQMPKFKAKEVGNVDAEKFFKRMIQDLTERGQRLGYREVTFAPFQKWGKGNAALESLGYRKHEATGELQKSFPVASRAERMPEAQDKARYFRDLASVLEAKRAKIEEILAKINTPEGTRFEFEQTLDALRNAEHLELHNLQSTKTLNGTAVYASTNVPLYTLVLHGLIPGSISKNVWFRTPERTRQVYRELYDLIAGSLPPDALHGFHLLTSNRDVQYDHFRNTYVLGLNPSGKFARDPAQAVIFVGSPKTAETIIDQVRSKFGELKGDGRAFKQVFLGYGAGMNPMVVTESTGNKIERAVDAALENVRINCAQDCSVPKLYLVHASLASSFRNQLLSKIRASMNELRRPLTMTKDFDRLIAYRRKYERYLVNKDAVLDPESKIVTPHVFSFPVSMVAEVELQEHFAPFLPVFSYQTHSQLESVARDPRLQKQAMFAQIFGGDRATPDLSDAKRVFQEQGHLVWTNRNLFSMESANMAFGGNGVETSMVYTTHKQPRAPPFQTRGHYPTLFSAEVAQAFAKDAPSPRPALQPPSFYRSKLQEAVALARKPSTPAHPGAAHAGAPSLGEIQAAAARGGLSQIYKHPKPAAPEGIARLEYWHGTKLAFTSDAEAAPLRSPGVMLHPLEINDDPAVINRIRGDLNPNNAQGTLIDHLDGNKLDEYHTTEAIWPGAMPRTETHGHLAQARILPGSFETSRVNLREKINELLKRGATLKPGERERLREELRELVESYFRHVRKIFPEGAFFKNFGEFATGDLGNQITSFGSSSKEIADEFLRRLETLASRGPGHYDLTRTPAGEMFALQDREMGSRFAHKLLSDPEGILIQQKVIIAKTELGFPKEIRVDFLSGQAITGRPRFAAEYQPEAVAKAKEIIDEFFRKAPPEFRHLSGGADVAQLADGRWVIIEFNYGRSSGTLSPGYYPIESHQYFSKLQGKKTAFLADLDRIYAKGVEGQREHLKSLRHERALWWRQGPEDLSVEDIGRYFRDRLLEDWAARGAKAEEAASVRAQLDRLFEGWDSEPIRRLKESAEHYLRRSQAERKSEG